MTIPNFFCFSFYCLFDLYFYPGAVFPITIFTKGFFSAIKNRAKKKATKRRPMDGRLLLNSLKCVCVNWEGAVGNNNYLVSSICYQSTINFFFVFFSPFYDPVYYMGSYQLGDWHNVKWFKMSILRYCNTDLEKNRNTFEVVHCTHFWHCFFVLFLILFNRIALMSVVVAAIMGALPTWHKYKKKIKKRQFLTPTTNEDVTHTADTRARCTSWETPWWWWTKRGKSLKEKNNPNFLSYPTLGFWGILLIRFRITHTETESFLWPITHHSTWLVKWCRQDNATHSFSRHRIVKFFFQGTRKKDSFFFFFPFLYTYATTTAFKMTTFYGHGMLEDYHCRRVW